MNSNPIAKYTNLSQFVLGISRVEDSTPLSKGERCFLHCLAVHANYRTGLSHPSMVDLQRCCCVKTRQGVQYIARQLIRCGLVEVSEPGNGRGHSTEYRIKTEDHRYPNPRSHSGTPEILADSEKLQSDEPESAKLEAEKCQEDSEKVPSPVLHTSFNALPKEHPQSIERLMTFFERQTGKSLLLTAADRRHVAAAIEEHGLDAICKTVALLTNSGTNWDRINTPARFSVCRYQEFIPEAVKKVAEEAQYA